MEFVYLLDDVDNTNSTLLRMFSATRIPMLPPMQEYFGEYITVGLERGDDNIRCFVYSLGINQLGYVNSVNAFLESPSKELFFEMLSNFKEGLRDAHGQILDRLEDTSIHPLRLNEAKALYERVKFIFGTEEPTKFEFSPSDERLGTIVGTEAGIYALHRYLSENEASKADGVNNTSENDSCEETAPTDYSQYYASVAPQVDYAQMRKIATLLTGKEIVGKSIRESQPKYIDASNVLRLCYFFLRRIESPDSIERVDFTHPIQWLGDWKSLKYLISRLYKNCSLPSNLAKEIVEAFRFKLQRQRDKSNPGKISESTFNNSKNITNIVPDEDRLLRIKEILKEAGIR